MDLFGNIIEEEPDGSITLPAAVSGDATGDGLKTIHTTPHKYELVDDESQLKNLVKLLSAATEICFDTETTGIDPNDAELVGMSFSIKPGEGYYVPCPPNQEETAKRLKLFAGLFSDASKTWVGQNLKYDMLMLKWYGYALKGNIFDTMLAHYVIEPDGKRGMDDLSAKYLGYEPVHIEELIGKRGKPRAICGMWNLKR